MTVVVTSDAMQTEKAVRAVADYEGPVYLRLSKGGSKITEDKGQAFILGKATVQREYGSDIAIIATGLLVRKALKAADTLEKNGIKATLLEIHTIKPLDNQAILEVADKTKAIVTVEEHSIIGGLGGAVAELLSEQLPSVSLERVGIKDTFAESGDYEGLLKKYGLTDDDIIAASRRVLRKKK